MLPSVLQMTMSKGSDSALGTPHPSLTVSQVEEDAGPSNTRQVHLTHHFLKLFFSLLYSSAFRCWTLNLMIRSHAKSTAGNF